MICYGDNYSPLHALIKLYAKGGNIYRFQDMNFLGKAEFDFLSHLVNFTIFSFPLCTSHSPPPPYIPAPMYILRNCPPIFGGQGGVTMICSFL